MEDINQIKDQLDKVLKELHALQQKRVYQADIIPDAVKSRHMGEGNRYIYAGLEANLPTEGNSVPQGISVYFCTDTNKLKIWNNTSWVSVTLT
jgi:hypothetical protein